MWKVWKMYLIYPQTYPQLKLYGLQFSTHFSTVSTTPTTTTTKYINYI